MISDFNPHDAARQKREDPMAFMSGSLQVEKQKLILKQALVDRPARGNIIVQKHSYLPQSLLFILGLEEDFVDDDDGGDSDPEAEFLATLTSKEKKKLLKRLQELEQGGEKIGEMAAAVDGTDSKKKKS